MFAHIARAIFFESYSTKEVQIIQKLNTSTIILSSPLLSTPPFTFGIETASPETPPSASQPTKTFLSIFPSPYTCAQALATYISNALLLLLFNSSPSPSPHHKPHPAAANTTTNNLQPRHPHLYHKPTNRPTAPQKTRYLHILPRIRFRLISRTHL